MLSVEEDVECVCVCVYVLSSAFRFSLYGQMVWSDEKLVEEEDGAEVEVHSDSGLPR